MPIAFIGEQPSSNLAQIGKYGAKYDYDYPMGLDLMPGSELHERIVKYVTDRARASYDIMSARHSSWKEVDETLTAYIRTDEKEQLVKNEDSRKPISIVVPQSYAVLEILLTYATSAMLEDPIFRYEGVGGEDVFGAILLEALISHQVYRSRMHLALHTFLRDNFAYGLGACGPVWTKKTAMVSRKSQSIFDRLLGREGTKRASVRETVYEGNVLENIDPYLFLPDPGVSIDRVQEGETVGWILRKTVMEMLRDESEDDGVFNCRYLKHIESPVSILNRDDRSGRNTKSGVVTPNSYASKTKFADTIYMYADIIPKDWKLPGASDNKNGEYPETWFFAVTGDCLVTLCDRLTLNHGMKPIVTGSCEYDGYSVAPVSRMETIKGLQTVLDWMFNSHVTNVRKALNDMLVVDPSLINMNDLKNPEPGKLIRMRRAAWGRGIKDAVMQLAVTDVTKQNVGDAAAVMELMKGLSGSVDSLSGTRRKTSERVTAEEVRSDKIGGLSRLERLVKIIGWMSFQPLGQMLADHTQQFMEEDTFVKIAGDRLQVLASEYGISGPRVPVGPLDILVNYDVFVRDGSVPGGNYSDMWAQMLPVIMQDMEVRQGMDVVKLIKYILRNGGVKDPHQFDRPIQTQIVPDEQAMAEAQAGNVVPMQEAI